MSNIGSTAPVIGRFRPHSINDFHDYAKALSWAIDEPLQKSQELLSRIYGFSGLHELQQEMKKPGAAGWMISLHESWRPETTARIIALVKQAKMDSGSAQAHEEAAAKVSAWRAVDLNLFTKPAEHRSAYQRMRSGADVMAGKLFRDEETGQWPAKLEQYASVVDGRIKYTKLGQAVEDALRQIVDSDNDETGPSHTLTRLEQIEVRHPCNPWAAAAILCNLAGAYGLGEWTDDIHRDRDPTRDHGTNPRMPRYSQFDVSPDRLERASKNATALLAMAKRAMGLFEQLMAGNSPEFDYYRASGAEHYLLSTLYWGARAALYSGDLELARKWGGKCLRLSGSDGYGARYFMAPLALNSGKGSIKAMFKGGDESGGDFSQAVECARKGNLSQAAEHFAGSLGVSWAAAEAVGVRWSEARQLGYVQSSQALPAHFQEFMHWSAPFWKSNDHVRQFFAEICSNNEVRQSAMACYQSWLSSWGSALRPKSAPAVEDPIIAMSHLASVVRRVAGQIIDGSDQEPQRERQR